MFNKIAKGEINISCVENRHFKRSKYVSNLCFLEGPPLTIFEMKMCVCFFFQERIEAGTETRPQKLGTETWKFYLVKL